MDVLCVKRRRVEEGGKWDGGGGVVEVDCREGEGGWGGVVGGVW